MNALIAENTTAAQHFKGQYGSNLALDFIETHSVRQWQPSLAVVLATAAPGVEPAQQGATYPSIRQVPERFQIGGGMWSGRTLARYVLALVWIEGQEFVAEQPDLRVHAFGNDRVEALLNLGEALVEQLQLLEEMGEKISAPLAREREYLRGLLVNAQSQS